jgi:histidinol-phosphate aminotransferase
VTAEAGGGMDGWESFIPDNIARLARYQPGKPVEELERELGITGAIKIASNENPLGPSPLGVDAARRALADAHAYPDDSCHRLRAALAARHGVGPDEIVFGTGSNELISMIVHAFCRPGVDEVVTHEHAFISYRLFAHAHDAPFVATAVTPELRCDVDALCAALAARTRVVFLANPNNPTGAHVTRSELERIIEALPPRTLLVVDEAYHEYAVAAAADYPSALTYRAGQPRLIVLRTFSKIHGLAGLRVGYAIAHPRVADYLNRVRRPFNVSTVAQAAALAALDDDAHVARSREVAAASLAAIAAASRRIGVTAYPTAANFVLVGLGRDAAPVYDALLRRGVIARPMAAWGLPAHLRISAAPADQVDRVVGALADVIG